MNKDIIVKKIEYLTSMPHSALVEHCIYLENENDNYKAQKYITDFISENGMICEKNKEITNLQQENKQLKEKYERFKNNTKIIEEFANRYEKIMEELEEWLNRDDLSYVETQLVLDKIQELKEKYK